MVGSQAGRQQGSTEAKAAAAVQSSSLRIAMMLIDSIEKPIALGNSAQGKTNFFSAKWLWQGPTTLRKEALSELENIDVCLYNFAKSMFVCSLEKFYTYWKNMFLTGLFLLFIPFCLAVCN